MALGMNGRRHGRAPAPSLWKVIREGLVILCVFCAGCAERSKPLPPGECGNGVLNLDEECDQGQANSDTEPDGCRTDCRWAYCGDGVQDSDEICDGDQLGGVTCLDRGYVEGTLACGQDCNFDESGCSTCGDQLVSGREECDGEDLGGLECRDVGFQSGALACGQDCRLDVRGCVGGCGNQVREGSEECDGEDLGGLQCADVGFESGVLACGQTCVFDFRGCVGGCGNGVQESGEACDDGNRVDYDGCTDCVAGDGTFGPPALLATCQWPVAVQVRDLDRDDAFDLVAGCVGGASGQGGVSVHRGVGDGTFEPAVFYPMNARVTALAVMDMDADGKLDAVASFYGPPDDPSRPGGVAVLRGLDNATFDASWAMPLGRAPSDLAVADFNDDGRLDVVVADGLEQRLYVLLGHGDGTLSATDPVYAFGGPVAVAVGDLDLDGVVDLVTLRQQYNLVAAYMGQGSAHFSASTARYVGERPVDVLVGSFNGDSYPDAVVVSAGSSTVSVLVGFGDGQFAYPGTVEVPGEPQAVTTGWIDGDPELDLVVAGTAQDVFWVLSGDGGGDYTRIGMGTDTCDSPVDLAAADFDGDGVMDMAVACSFGDQLAVHPGNAAAVAQ